MTILLAFALSLAAPAQEMVTIRVEGRDMTGLHNRETVLRGTCDGRPASATITMAYSGQRARLVLRAGRWARDVPTTFLNGSLVRNGLNHAGLACDGRRLQLSGLAIRTDAGGEIVMDAQNAVLDLRTGELSVTDLRTFSPAETRAELR